MVLTPETTLEFFHRTQGRLSFFENNVIVSHVSQATTASVCLVAVCPT